MSERNYLNVQGTLPDFVTSSPERVQKFVRTVGGSLSESPAEYGRHVYVSITIPLRFRLPDGRRLPQALSQISLPPTYDASFMVAYDAAWASGRATNTPDEAYKKALIGAWMVVVEFARWKHAQDAILDALLWEPPLDFILAYA